MGDRGPPFSASSVAPNQRDGPLNKLALARYAGAVKDDIVGMPAFVEIMDLMLTRTYLYQRSLCTTYLFFVVYSFPTHFVTILFLDVRTPQ